MIPLKYGERASRNHFPTDADEWDLHLKYNLEKAAIDKYLVEIAGANWRQFKEVKKAIAQGQQLTKDIIDKYTPSDLIPDTRIYEDAARGALRRECPTLRAIYTMMFAFWLSVVMETTVMVIQQAFTGDFNPFIIVLAILLALGGFLQGQGLGHYLVKRWKEDTNRPQKGEGAMVAALEFGIGTALILLISVVRGLSSFEPVMMVLVFTVTLLFGEAVAVCEAVKERYKGMRDTLLAEMEDAQTWQANKSHLKHLDASGYLQTYEAAVEKFDQVGAQVTLPEEATPSPLGPSAATPPSTGPTSAPQPTGQTGG